jgi:hypothetical protein
MAVASRVRREETDALRKASEDGESEIASKISRKQLEEHTGTENKGSSNFERNHFCNVPSSNGEAYNHQIIVATRVVDQYRGVRVPRESQRCLHC